MLLLLYRERRLRRRRRRCRWVVRGGICKRGCSDSSRYLVGCVECIDLRLDEVVLVVVVVVSSGGGWCWRWC